MLYQMFVTHLGYTIKHTSKVRTKKKKMITIEQNL